MGPTLPMALVGPMLASPPSPSYHACDSPPKIGQGRRIDRRWGELMLTSLTRSHSRTAGQV